MNVEIETDSESGLLQVWDRPRDSAVLLSTTHSIRNDYIPVHYFLP